MKKFKLILFLITFISLSCEEKISQDDLNNYKSIMDTAGHLIT